MIVVCPVLLSYPVRLLCLCLEMIFLVNLALSAAVVACARPAARAARSMQPQRAARLFFTLRQLPFMFSLLIVAALCLPTYLRYERNTGSEPVGWFCLTTAALGLSLGAASACGCIRALNRLWVVQRRLRSLPVQPSALSATPMCVAADHETSAPLLALAGIRRPRLVVSQRLLNALSAQQLEVAISHERAHQASRDNLKRLLLAIVPGAFPFLPGLRDLERQWEHYAELAADVTATGGHAGRAVALAEALVQVARLRSYDPRSYDVQSYDLRSYDQGLPLTSALSSHDLELAFRVDRLLASAPAGASPRTFAPSISSNRLARQSIFSQGFFCWARDPVRGSLRHSATLWSSVLLLAAVAMLPLLGLLHPLYPLLESLLH